jgi:hypothetical protein
MHSVKHTFRLQGPWKCRFYPLGKPDGSSFAIGENYNGEEFKVSMPKSWQEIAGENAGLMKLSRSFHLPSNLEVGDELFLRLEEVHAKVNVFCVNELLSQQQESSEIVVFKLPKPLPAAPSISIEISTNEKTDWSNPIGLWKVVSLEIRIT